MAEIIDADRCDSCTEDGAPRYEVPGIGTTSTEVIGTAEMKTSVDLTASNINHEHTGNTEPSLEGVGITESGDICGPDVVLDCTRPHLDLQEKTDLATETNLDILNGNVEKSESHHEETSSVNFKPEAGHHIETETGSRVINASQDSTEIPTHDVSSGSCPASSIPEPVSTSGLPDESRRNAEEDDDDDARVKFEPGVKCSDASKAVEILKTSYRLSDVTIRKNMITWSCWNIADVIRGPHKETTWWKGGTLPRRKTKEESEELQEVIAEELSGDEEFRQEMAELCRKIDTRDRELVLILDDILHVAQQNNGDLNTVEQADPIEVLHGQTAKNQPTASRMQSAASSPDYQTSTPGNDENTSLDKHRNPFARVMRAIRRRFSRRNQTRKCD